MDSMWRLDQYRQNCLGTNYDDINPKCVTCDDRKECCILKLRWENKIKELFTKKVGITVVKSAVPVSKKNRTIKKGKVQLERELRAKLIEEAKQLGIF